MEKQLYVIVDVPISFKDKEHDELAYDIERYGGSSTRKNGMTGQIPRSIGFPPKLPFP